MMYVTSAGGGYGIAAIARTAAAALMIIAAFTLASSAQAQKAAKESKITKNANAPKPLKPEKISWYKLCYDIPNAKDQTKKRQECATSDESYHPVTGQLALLALVKTDVESKQDSFMVTVPLGAFIPTGAQARVDKEKPVPLRFVYCAQPGCVATMPSPKEVPDFIKKLQSGKELIVQYSDVRGQPRGLKIALKGFTNAYKGKSIKREKYIERAKSIETKVKARQAELKKRFAEAQKNQKKK
jgi:invasion protein IalB